MASTRTRQGPSTATVKQDASSAAAVVLVEAGIVVVEAGIVVVVAGTVVVGALGVVVVGLVEPAGMVDVVAADDVGQTLRFRLKVHRRARTDS